MGDAGKFLDAGHPEKGLVFDGRVAEDFKLQSGTWVNVGSLRLRVVTSLGPVVQDAVIAGHDRDRVGVLAFANPAGCAQIGNISPDTPSEELVKLPEVKAFLRNKVEEYNTQNPQNSTRIACLMLMADPPSIDADEITDKGYVNQLAVLSHRRDLVEKLYAADPDDTEVMHFE
jgi:feruloyl-CoA synthase